VAGNAFVTDWSAADWHLDSLLACCQNRAGSADAAISPTLVELTTHTLMKAGSDVNLVASSLTV
jgi:hypothetical protein